MNPNTYIAKGFIYVDNLIKTVEKWSSYNINSYRNYNAKIIAQRLTQEICFKYAYPCLEAGAKNYNEKIDEYLAGSPYSYYDGIKINLFTGKPRPKFKLYFSSLLRFIIMWHFVLFQFFRNPLRKHTNVGSAALVHGVPFSNLNYGGDDEKFSEYCHKGPLRVLNRANKILVQTNVKIKNKTDEDIIYTRFPLLTLLELNSYNINERFSFLINHSLNFVFFFYNSLRNPIVSILWHDCAVDAAAALLNKKNLIESVVLTNTNWAQQFLWMTDLQSRNYKTYMALYSLNSSMLQFKTNPIFATSPIIRHLRVDTIWVWDKSDVVTLNNDGVFCKAKVVAPILWYLPDNKIKKNVSSNIRICVFDVTPMTDGMFKSIGLVGHYYSSETMISFLDEILNAADEAGLKLNKNIEVILKPKREHSKFHDIKYSEKLEEFLSCHDNFKKASADENLFTLISESDLAIVIPFSSPAFIAKYMKIPAIYYDPKNIIRPKQCNTQGIKFISEKKYLVDEIINSVLH